MSDYAKFRINLAKGMMVYFSVLFIIMFSILIAGSINQDIPDIMLGLGFIALIMFALIVNNFNEERKLYSNEFKKV